MSYRRSRDDLAGRRPRRPRISSRLALEHERRSWSRWPRCRGRRARRARAARPGGARSARASSKRPLLCSGRPQQPWRGHDHLEAVVLQHGHGPLGRAGLVVVGAAAVEEDDRARRARRVRRPAARRRRERSLEGAPGPARASAPSRWMPSVLSSSRAHEPVAHASSWRSARPARPGGPASVGPRDAAGRAAGRRGRSFSRARAWELISAIFTPCGQTWVQMPQLEQ